MTNEEKIKLAEECGLVFDGMINLDGEDWPQFIGDDKAWEKYDNALKQK